MVPLTAIREFLRLQAAGGLIVATAATAAILVANTPLAWLYDGLLATPMIVQVGALSIAKPLLIWLNDALMAVLFFLIGLEIKRQVREGELSSPTQAMLPAAAAVGGLVLPALIYVGWNAGQAATLPGWAIPAGTDIALALVALSLAGSRVPASLRVLLLSAAVMANAGAMLVQALVRAGDLPLLSLGLALIGLGGLATLNRLAVTRLAGYLLIGISVWVCLLPSGTHAALAGVATAIFIPMGSGRAHEDAPLKTLERALHPWVALGILPAFAFLNAGVAFAGLPLSGLFAPVPLGIAVGLFVGKQIGVLGCVALAVRLGWCRLPSGVTWLHVYGVALLTGIGFTMSLFFASLALGDATLAAGIRFGVIAGSLLSAGAGIAVLRFLAGRA